MFEAFQSSYVTLKVDPTVGLLTRDVELDQLHVVAAVRIQDRIMHDKLLRGILVNLVFAKELLRFDVPHADFGVYSRSNQVGWSQDLDAVDYCAFVGKYLFDGAMQGVEENGQAVGKRDENLGL